MPTKVHSPNFFQYICTYDVYMYGYVAQQKAKKSCKHNKHAAKYIYTHAYHTNNSNCSQGSAHNCALVALAVVFVAFAVVVHVVRNIIGRHNLRLLFMFIINYYLLWRQSPTSNHQPHTPSLIYLLLTQRGKAFKSYHVAAIKHVFKLIMSVWQIFV